MNKTDHTPGKDKRIETLDNICHYLQKKIYYDTAISENPHEKNQIKIRIKGLKTAIRVLKNMPVEKKEG